MENRTLQKGQNLLEDFVWSIDTGSLMGNAYPHIAMKNLMLGLLES